MEKIKKLLSRAFNDPPEYLDYLEEIGFLKPGEAFRLNGDNGPVSVLFAKKYPVNVGTGQLTADYIFYAATEEKQRNAGNMGKLLSETLSVLKNRGGDVAVIIPATRSLFDYYAKFGFTTAFYIKKKEFYPKKTGKTVYVPTIDEAVGYYVKYFDCYAKMQNTLFKTEELFVQSVKENLFDGTFSSVLTDGENFAFASFHESVVLREFVGNGYDTFAEAVAWKYGRPVTLCLPADNKEEPLGMIYSYNGKTGFPPLYADNMLN